MVNYSLGNIFFCLLVYSLLFSGKTFFGKNIFIQLNYTLQVNWKTKLKYHNANLMLLWLLETESGWISRMYSSISFFTFLYDKSLGGSLIMEATAIVFTVYGRNQKPFHTDNISTLFTVGVCK